MPWSPGWKYNTSSALGAQCTHVFSSLQLRERYEQHRMAGHHFYLNTGARIPVLGFGTWQGKPGETRKAVMHALLAGYTHIDCGIPISQTPGVFDISQTDRC